jgi:23S rRNA (uracil1939-C5)-methyltransferase
MGRKIEAYTIEITLTDAASDGRAVGRHEGWVVFVQGGVPGDVAEVQIYRKEQKNLVGRIQRLLQPSPHRVQPVCRHFGLCGGCKWQHLEYQAQIQQKENQVVNILRRVGKLSIPEVRPILGVEHPYFYRNKLEFTFATRAFLTKEDLQQHPDFQLDQRVLGFHAPKFWDKILHIDECHLQHPRVNDIRNEVQRFAKEQDCRFYNLRDHTGFLRNLVFRSSRSSGEIMLILVVSENRPEQVETLFRHLEALFPEITSFIWVLNAKFNSVYNDQPYQVWKGPGYYTEKLGPYSFRVRPVSFFQPNPGQAERLYGLVKEMLQEALPPGQARHKTLYDLYSGTGSIGIFVSELAEKIVGVEYVESAVQDAWENVRLNQLPESQFSFYAGDMKELLTSELVEREGTPDVIVADPPRQGMDPRVVMKILELKPAHIIYVSCKPATQARDLYMLGVWYEVLRIQPVDMFPHTAHVENIAFLRRRSAPQEQTEVSEGSDAADMELDEDGIG